MTTLRERTITNRLNGNHCTRLLLGLRVLRLSKLHIPACFAKFSKLPHLISKVEVFQPCFYIELQSTLKHSILTYILGDFDHHQLRVLFVDHATQFLPFGALCAP